MNPNVTVTVFPPLPHVPPSLISGAFKPPSALTRILGFRGNVCVTGIFVGAGVGLGPTVFVGVTGISGVDVGVGSPGIGVGVGPPGVGVGPPGVGVGPPGVGPPGTGVTVGRGRGVLSPSG